MAKVFGVLFSGTPRLGGETVETVMSNLQWHAVAACGHDTSWYIMMHHDTSWYIMIPLVVWNVFYFPIYWEYCNPIIFQRGSNHQPDRRPVQFHVVCNMVLRAHGFPCETERWMDDEKWWKQMEKCKKWTLSCPCFFWKLELCANSKISKRWTWDINGMIHFHWVCSLECLERPGSCHQIMSSRFATMTMIIKHHETSWNIMKLHGQLHRQHHGQTGTFDRTPTSLVFASQSLMRWDLCLATAMERSTMLLIGKPSISIRAIYTMAMLVITRG